MAPSKETPRPTTRQIAAIVGISSTAVSMALRDNPKISAAMRQKVRQAAAKLGYRPDPSVAKLMHHLRSRNKSTYHSTLCAITTIGEGQAEVYLAEMIRSATNRADELGYKLSVMHIEDSGQTRQDLQRMLRSRGIEGILLLPLRQPREIFQLLDWSEFSVVSATYAVLAPHFHRVVPHQFSNMMLICEKLKERGYRRIGLIIHSNHDLRVHHSFSAAVSWQNLLGGTEFVRPLIYSEELPLNLEEWIARESPDVVVSAGGIADRTIFGRQLKLAGNPIGQVFTSITPDSGLKAAGIWELPAEIGARAIEQLAGMVQRGEKGIPQTPTVTMIEGSWIDGASIKTIHDKRRTRSGVRSQKTAK